MSSLGWTILQSATNSVLNRFTRCVVPLYTYVGSAIAAWGSGVLTSGGGRYFLLTAAHVLDRHATTPLVIWTGSTERFVSLDGEAVVTPKKDGNRNRDRLDLAVVTLRPRCVRLLQDSDFEFGSHELLGEESSSGGIYAFAGYPASENDPKATTTEDGRQVNLMGRVLHVVNLAPGEPKAYRRAGCDPEVHFVSSFNRHQLMSSGGVAAKVGHPFGMSGGGIFYLGEFSEILSGTARPHLAGIGIEYLDKHQLLVASGTKVLAKGLLQALERPALED